MGFLAAAVVFGLLFALGQRFAQARGIDYFLVTTTNFITGFLGVLIWTAAQGRWDAAAIAYGLGALTGLAFAVAISLQYFMLAWRGVGITYTFARLSVIAPIVVSLTVFGEPAEPLMLTGIVFVVAAVPLIGYRRGRMSFAVADRSYWALVAALLAVTGGASVLRKVLVEVAPPDDIGAFVLATFGVAAIFSMVSFTRRRRFQPVAPGSREMGAVRTIGVPLALGGVMGGLNVGALWLFLIALNHVPGAVAFPALAAASVVLTTLAGWIFWRERHRLLTLLGIAASVVGLVLVNV